MGRGWRYHQDWGRGMIGPGMTGQGGLMDRGDGVRHDDADDLHPDGQRR